MTGRLNLHVFQSISHISLLRACFLLKFQYKMCLAYLLNITRGHIQLYHLKQKRMRVIQLFFKS